MIHTCYYSVQVLPIESFKQLPFGNPQGPQLSCSEIIFLHNYPVAVDMYLTGPPVNVAKTATVVGRCPVYHPPVGGRRSTLRRIWDCSTPIQAVQAEEILKTNRRVLIEIRQLFQNEESRIQGEMANKTRKEVGCCRGELSDFIVQRHLPRLKMGQRQGTCVDYGVPILSASTRQLIWDWSMTPPLLLKHRAVRHSSSLFILSSFHFQNIKKCLLLLNSSRLLAPLSFATLVSSQSDYLGCIENTLTLNIQVTSPVCIPDFA